MGTQQVKAWVCDKCGHTWIAGELVPTHCASSKCRSRQWNQPIILGKFNDAPGSLNIQPLLNPEGQVLATRLHNPKTCRIYKCGMCAAMKL